MFHKYYIFFALLNVTIVTAMQTTPAPKPEPVKKIFSDLIAGFKQPKSASEIYNLLEQYKNLKAEIKPTYNRTATNAVILAYAQAAEVKAKAILKARAQSYVRTVPMVEISNALTQAEDNYAIACANLKLARQYL
jgi:hypothetical protein